MAPKKAPPYTQEENDLAEKILTMCMRGISQEYPYLQKPLYSLKLCPFGEVRSIGADYNCLYYNPVWVIEFYSKSKKKLPEVIIHCVMHCLLLHPTANSEANSLFDSAADASVLCMMKSANALPSVTYNTISSIDKLASLVESNSAADIFSAASKKQSVKSLMKSICSAVCEDDHSVWFNKPAKNSKSDNISRGAKQQTSEQSSLPKEDAEGNAAGCAAGENSCESGESEWISMLSESKNIASGMNAFGNSHGGMFEDIKKPDRFSRFSYREYIRRFTVDEIMSEDPESLDPIMYTWGMDNLEDTPIVEFSETREQSTPTDIIIAIDVSGSCGGEIASNFLRQVYSLFTEMNIRSSVNINVVTFDTCITDSFTVKSAKDAQRLVDKYDPAGWGGTDFICVFNYADDYRKKNKGKKLRGLFFFSDAYGPFPDSAPKYKTTFFVPQTNDLNDFGGFGGNSYEFVPEWVELVKYNDE